MAYTPCYPNKRNWANLPSESSPINETNLNAMDNAIYTNDGRIVELSGRLDTDETALGNKVDKQSGKGLSEIKSITISPSVNTGTKIAEISYKNQDNLTIGYEIKNGVVVDSALSGSSTNPVQNKVVKSALDGKSTVSIANTLPTGDTIANLTINGTTTAIKAPLVEVDDELSTSSTNPVQNKIITEALREIMPEVTVTGNPISISDGSNIVPAKLAEVTFLPKQDLHGYDNPWVGGAGKNKFHNTAESTTTQGITLTVNADGTITGQNNATGTAVFYIANVSLPNGNYILNGCPSGGGSTTYKLDISKDGTFYTDNGSGVSFTVTDQNPYLVRLVVYSGNGNGKVFKPMIRLATVADDSFAPWENKCPISGRTQVSVKRTGVNIVDIDNAYNFEKYSGGTRNGFDIKNIEGTFTISGNGNTDAISYAYKNNQGVWREGSLLTTETSETFTTYGEIQIWCGNDIKSKAPKLQLEFGSTATAYEPYQGETVTVQLGQTVYGGTLDVTNGKLTIDSIIVDMGDLSYNYNSQYNTFATGVVSDMADMISDKVQLTCSTLKGITPKSATAMATVDDSTIAFNNNASLKFFRIKCTAYTDADVFKTAMTGQKIVYKIATPIEITLTPEQISLLKGNNVISTDGDNINLVYSADIKAWVENQLSNS